VDVSVGRHRSRVSLSVACPARARFKAAQAQQRASHETVHILFLANDFAVPKSRKSVWPLNLDFELDVMT